MFLKLVNAAGERQPLRITISGAGNVSPQAKALVLTSSSPQDTNTLREPTKVVPATRTLTGIAPSFDLSLDPYSVTVLEIARAR